MRYLRLVLPALALAVLWASPSDLDAETPVTFHCAWDESCPEVSVAGDPHATLGGGPAPFRGYGDPSLELDPATGALWMSYSWLDVLVSDPGPPPTIDFGVRTHLARSDDGGATFTFVREVNQTTAIVHPDDGQEGWATHEVSTLAREAAGSWQILWLTYFDPFGPPPYYDVYYNRSVAGAPDELGDVVEPWIRGAGTSPSFGAQRDLSAIPELSDCAAFTEPALLAHQGDTYLATNCVVFADGARRDDLERLVLLREETGGYGYVGELLDYADAQDLGATRIEQADLALSRSGAVLLIATPILTGGAPEHLGCVAFEVSDIANAQVRRDASGDAELLAYITGEDDTIGPGLCTYDAASDTGVLMVLHAFSADPFDMEFSLRATGVHPDVACSPAVTPWPVPAGDDDCDGFETARESFVGTDPNDDCPDDASDDAWPPDFNRSTNVNVVDVLFFAGRMGAEPPDPAYGVRYDFDGSGKITIVDVLFFPAFIQESCTNP